MFLYIFLSFCVVSGTYRVDVERCDGYRTAHKLPRGLQMWAEVEDEVIFYRCRYSKWQDLQEGGFIPLNGGSEYVEVHAIFKKTIERILEKEICLVIT